MANLCEEHGDDFVVYHGRECPFCTALSDNDDLQAALEEAREEARSAE